MSYPTFAALRIAGADPAQPPRKWPRVARGCRTAVLVGIAATAAGVGPSGAPATVDQAWVAVEALVGTPRCRTDSDCRSIGVGARACGGPETYLAWSNQVTHQAALESAVARHAALRRAADAKAGMESPCVVAEAPAVHCRKAGGQAWGVCVLSPVTSGPGGTSTQR